MRKSKVAIFDIDGTIFRSSLLVELVEVLVAKGLFSGRVRDDYSKTYEAWFNRKGSYEEYIDSVVLAFRENIKGLNYSDYLKAVNQVIADNKDRVYRYTRDLIVDLKQDNYYLLAISNSPKEVVQTFAQELGFDKIYGRKYEVVDGKFSGEILHLDLVSDKSKIIKRVLEKEKISLVESIGVGDSEGDIPLLKMVENPICFNPNRILYNTAKRLGWSIVVERKDVVYKI